jgi:hypothetical protein
MYLGDAMNPTKRSLALKVFVALAALVTLAVLTMTSGTALAAGGFSIKTTEVDEKGGEWHVKVRIDLPRTPAMMHVPMRLTFSKEVVDERAIMSKGAEPQHHRMVLDTVQKQIVGMDVDFADPGGKVFKSTYFEFDLRRATGYFEAGEYVVALAGPDGEIGGTQKLTLKGDNPPVYRGAMDFASNANTKKKGPKIEAVSSGLDGGTEVAKNDTPASAGPASTDVAPSGNAPDMIPKNAFNKTAEEESVQEHPKGCGCVLAGLEPGPLAGGGAALVGLGLVFARRLARRRGKC